MASELFKKEAKSPSEDGARGRPGDFSQSITAAKRQGHDRHIALLSLMPPSRARAIQQDSSSQQGSSGEVAKCPRSSYAGPVAVSSALGKVVKAEVKGLPISRSHAQSSETKQEVKPQDHL